MSQHSFLLHLLAAKGLSDAYGSKSVMGWGRMLCDNPVSREAGSDDVSLSISGIQAGVGCCLHSPFPPQRLSDWSLVVRGLGG